MIKAIWKVKKKQNTEWIAYKFDALQSTEISQTICYAFYLTRQLGLEDNQTIYNPLKARKTEIINKFSSYTEILYFWMTV